MAAGDLNVISAAAGVRKYRTGSGSTDINAGEPVNLYGTYSTGEASANLAIALTDGKPAVGTDNFAGIAASNSTHTASVDGIVTVVVPRPYETRIRGKAKTGTNIDTDSELEGVLGDVVLFDLTSSTYTIDETAAGDTSGLRIEDGDTVKLTLDVTVDARAMRNDVS